MSNDELSVEECGNVSSDVGLGSSAGEVEKKDVAGMVDDAVASGNVVGDDEGECEEFHNDLNFGCTKRRDLPSAELLINEVEKIL